LLLSLSHPNFPTGYDLVNQPNSASPFHLEATFLPSTFRSVLLLTDTLARSSLSFFLLINHYIRLRKAGEHLGGLLVVDRPQSSKLTAASHANRDRASFYALAQQRNLSPLHSFLTTKPTPRIDHI
jgi:hypothetical protein